MNFFADDRDLRFNYFFWIGLLAIMLIRSFYFGITYFNFLDDYNTYGIFYRLNDDIFNDIILWYGLYTFRPIAFLADAYITQWFWPNMWLVLLFYTIMHFFTVLIFHRTLKYLGINFGAFGIIIISLTPILFEAVYWIGASTRLVPGMFFSILSSYFLVCFLDLHSRRIYYKRYLVLYVFFNFLSTGFYEQIIVFNFVFTCFVIFLSRYKIQRHFRLIVLTPFLSTIFIGLFYLLLAPHGKVADRGALVPFNEIFSQVSLVVLSVGNLLINVNWEISSAGFLRGLTLISGFWQVVGLLFVIIFTIVVYLSLMKRYLAFEDSYDDKFLFRLFMGFVLTMTAFGPFYLLQNSFMAPRTVYPAIFGIAIFLDTLLSMVSTTKISVVRLRILKPIISTIFIIPFFIIYIAEVNNFRLLEEADTKIMSNFLEVFTETGIDDQTMIVLFNTQYSYADTTTQGHRLENVTSSDWALKGKANATSRDFRFTQMQPIQSERLLPKEWVTNENGLFGIDEELSIYHLYLISNTLFINNTDIIFGLLEYYDDYSLKFIRHN